MLHILDIVSIGCIGLLIGTEFAVAVFINPILWRLEYSAQLSAMRMFAKRLGAAMPFWYAASLLLLIVEAVVRRHQANLVLVEIAGSIWAAVIVLTLLYLVPINNRLAQLGQHSVAAVARQHHKQWDTMHRYRVAALGVSMVCFLMAMVG
jgi:uncharacterized membrane protein